MDNNEFEAIRESFDDFRSEIEDHRLDRHKLHSVSEILFLVMCALICGCEGWRDIERYGKLKVELLRKFFPYQHGTPSDDTLRRFFRVLNPVTFRTCFVQWVQSLKLTNDQHIAIDGKVSRRTHDGEAGPLHIVSAFASEDRLVLAQEKVDDKSNEIKAIPVLLELLDLNHATVTIDAIGCQKEFAQMIGDKNADYILALKGNQGTLHKDTKLLFQDEDVLKDLNAQIFQTIDGSEHGRIEKRTYKVVAFPESFKEQHNWPYLKSLVEVTSRRDLKDITSEEKRYYITSIEQNAPKIGSAIRSHWAIENSLHWILDVSFRDDDSRIRKGHAPQNIALIKHMTLNLLQKSKGKRDSIKQLRKAAGWNDQLLVSILGNI